MICRTANVYSVSYARCQISLVFGVPNTPELKNVHYLLSQTNVPFFWVFYERKTSKKDTIKQAKLLNLRDFNIRYVAHTFPLLSFNLDSLKVYYQRVGQSYLVISSELTCGDFSRERCVYTEIWLENNAEHFVSEKIHIKN